jgi:hypothetical protein
VIVSSWLGRENPSVACMLLSLCTTGLKMQSFMKYSAVLMHGEPEITAKACDRMPSCMQVEVRAVTKQEEAKPAGPSCNTLFIYHTASIQSKDPILIERAEALLCPACGMACSSAAGLHAHIVACHENLEIKFAAKDTNTKGDKGRKGLEGGKTSWKMFVSSQVNPAHKKHVEQRDSSWHQNFAFWVCSLEVAACFHF